MSNVWIGIDTGGTFTDLVLCDMESGRYLYHKLPTITADPAKAVIDGVSQILELAAVPPSRLQFLVLGTTLATNAVLEHKCAPTGMITTDGFSDILELARQRRPHYFNMDVPKPVPPAPQECRVEVTERMAPDGSVVTPLDEDAVRGAVDFLRGKGVEAVSICMMNSYANPDHERRAAAIVREAWPEAYVCASAEILPEFREYERFSTTVVNASLMPIMDRYLERFANGIRALGANTALRVMQSNGGAVSPNAVRRAPVNTFFSGPAGGIIGCVGIGEELGLKDLISFDVGGTSTDVCLVSGGEPAKKDLREMAGFPVRTRSIDIHTIGAGGGSIAWVDPGGLLKVGPQSAGAYPGPAAYGRGGDLPTVTDANVVLGRLNPVSLLGGRMAMYPDRAKDVIRKLASRLKMDTVDAAGGVIEIINVNMMGAVRVISVEQGSDPRDATLIAFGGAGPLHAADIARNMGIGKVLVPPHPGLLSALGLLHADVKGDFSMTCLVVADPANVKTLRSAIDELKRRGTMWLKDEDGRRNALFEWWIDMRYLGQNYELSLELPGGRIDAKSLTDITGRFHSRHKTLYGYDMPERKIESVRMRLVISIQRPLPTREKLPVRKGKLADALIGRRPVWFPESGFRATPVYDRDRLPMKHEIAGPAIIEQMDTTTVVPPRTVAHCDTRGYLHLAVDQKRKKG